MDDHKTLTPLERLKRLEQSIERWRRKPVSRRQRMILAGYRRAASELRKQIAAVDNYPPSPEAKTLGDTVRPLKVGTYTPRAPYRVFHVIRHPDGESSAQERPLERVALRVVARREE